jgi:hypothetical protein
MSQMLNHNKQQQLNEGLRPGDLQDLIEPTFYVDKFRSKMGEDRDVCVVSFSVKDRLPARDMMEFIEKGYQFVLDADVSSGEDADGGYTVFVELERQSNLHENIKEIIEGLKRLTKIDEWSFRYHKNFETHELGENLEKIIPNNANEYDGLMTRFKTEGIKKFFNKTLMDDLKLDGDVITIYKPFNQKLQFKLVAQDTTEKILEGATSQIQVDDKSMSEVFWLTKVIGDYGITKIGNQFLLKNKNESLIVERLI